MSYCIISYMMNDVFTFPHAHLLNNNTNTFNETSLEHCLVAVWNKDYSVKQSLYFQDKQ